MRYSPGAGPGKERMEAAIARELAELQPAIEQLSQQQAEMEQHLSSLQSQLVACEHALRLARQSDQEHRARGALEQRRRLLPQLFSLQQRLSLLQRERAPLEQQQAALLARLSALRGGPPMAGTAGGAGEREVRAPYGSEHPGAWWQPASEAQPSENAGAGRPQAVQAEGPQAPEMRERGTVGREWPGLVSPGGPQAPDAGGASWPPPDEWTAQPQHAAKPNSRLLLVILGGLALLVVLAPLALKLAQPSTPASTTQTTPVASPTPTATPAEQTPAYTPAGTAPTSTECQRAIHALCYSPEQIQQAFSLSSLYKRGYDGRGQTIVILGVGNTTTLTGDLHQFDRVWGLPDPSFTILHPFGAPTPYTCGPVDNLRIEDTLDVEWAHAIAPGARILLVIGSNNSGGSRAENCNFVNLEETFTYALDHRLGNIISISYGGSELGAAFETSSEKALDRRYMERGHALFQRAMREGITVLAAAGDSGVTNPDGDSQNSLWDRPNVAWPASDPNVLAVGGTSLTLADETGVYGSETVWNAQGGATGGGLSAIFTEPDYQQGLSNQALLQGQRGIPDVSFPAAVNYDLYGSFFTGELGLTRAQWRHWGVIGGTSAASPCWAGLIAIADQMRGEPLGLVQPALYSLEGKYLHDITVGDNSLGGVTGYQALPGFDLASGWGTPIADQLLPALVQTADKIEYGCPGSHKLQCF